MRLVVWRSLNLGPYLRRREREVTGSTELSRFDYDLVKYKDLLIYTPSIAGLILTRD